MTIVRYLEMVMTRSQTAAAAAASASIAAVHAAATPSNGGNKRRVRMTWTEEEDWVAKILLQLAGQPVSMHSDRYAMTELSREPPAVAQGQAAQQRPRRTCAKY